MPRYPTLRQRIAASRRRLPLSPVMRAASNGATTFVIDPDVAKSLLADHELLLLTSGSSSSDDESAEGCHENNGGTYASLEKPTKPTRLLHHALTNANGEIWARQRHCVGRAFAVDKATRGAYAGFAVDKAVALVEEAATRRGRKRRSKFSFMQKVMVWGCREKGGVDIRGFAREVAIHALSRIVLGCNENEAVVNALRKMVRDTLEPRRDEEHSKESESVVERLDRAVREAIDIAKDESGPEDGCPCLVQRLRGYERIERTEGEGGKYYLTRDEVVGNAHSAMLAGVQTISTTLAGALLHLAERPDLQRELREGSLSGKEVVHETLRILPPVAGLPRVPKECDLDVVRNGGDGCVTSCPVRKGGVVVIDVLAFAHAQQSKMEETAPRGNDVVAQDIRTLQFDPYVKQKTEAQPWGIGKRRCPAGVISVECIGAVLEAIAKEGYAWSLSNPKDGVAHRQSDTGGWYETICYRPTLSYGKPLMIAFHRQKGSKSET